MLVYQNYHRHSHYTNPRVPDSVATNEDYAKRAVELGQTILSSCEHGWQGYYAECYELAKTYGLKMLFSAEAYWVKDRLEKDKTNCHIFLAAKNERGRQALNDVLSEANISGFYGRPRLDLPLLLSLPPDDIWCTSACIAGWLYEDADDLWKQLADHFGKNFYLEVQYHDCNFREDAPYASQASLNAHVVELSRRWDVPLIMGCDSHYILPEDKQRCLDYTTSKNVVYEDEAGMILDYPDGDTAYQRFAKQAVLTHDEIMEAINNTNVFLEVEEYDSPIFNTEIKMPLMYPDWTQEQKDEEYKRLVLSGWDAYKHEVPEDQWPHYEEEIAKEMQVVIDTKMADYFILNYHVIKRGKENGGWLTKTGRGCFTESAMVKTLTGLKSIKDVQIGDTVFDLEGKPRKVLNTMKYSINEPMVQIDNVYSYGKHYASVCTPDHKIYVLRDGAHQWVPAGALKETDYLVRPKLHLDENGPQIIDLANYIDSKDWYDDEYVYEYNQYRSSYPYCPKHVSSLIGCGKSVMEHTGNGKPPTFKGKHQWILDKFFEVTPFTSLEEYAAYVKEKRTTKISRYIQVDATFCRFLGLMYGDGFSSDKVGGEIGLALNATNRKMRENRITFCEIAKRLGLQTSERKSTNRQLVQIYMYSRVFKKFLHAEVFVSKKGQDKLVNPQWVLQPKENRRGLLNGLLLADGSSCEKGRVSFDNTSLSLINVVDILIGSLGNEPVSISKRPAWIDSRGYHCRDSYKLRYYTESQTTAKYNERAIIHEEYTYYPVRSTIQLPARPVDVYDLEVEGSHSYVLNGFVVHNSCVSFITNKLLGFTEVDRIAAPVHMYPERFMSTERILDSGSLPD